jgi:hypothetical protein
VPGELADVVTRITATQIDRDGQGPLLIRREIEENVCGFLRPLGRAGNKPAGDDLISRKAGVGLPETSRVGTIPAPLRPGRKWERWR